MTRQHEIPELNYILVSGRVIEKSSMSTSKFNLYVIRFRVENTLTHDSVDGRKSTYDILVEAWGELAEDVERNLSTGAAVLVEGSLVSRKHLSRKQDSEFNEMIVKASSVSMLDART